MKIQKMFKDDINRPINGVVQVEQDTERVLIQELDEYVVTKELKKHFITLFNNYGDAFDNKTKILPMIFPKLYTFHNEKFLFVQFSQK